MENVEGLLSNVASIVRYSRVHHRFAHLVARSPNWLAHVLLELHHVLLALFFVDVLLGRLGRVGASESLVVTNVSGVAAPERSEHGRFYLSSLLFGEFSAVGKGQHISVEGAVLADHLTEGFVTVQNFGVQASVFVTVKIFLTLIWVLRVALAAQILELGERLGSFTVVKAGNMFVSRLRVLLHVSEFTFADSAVTVHGKERL